jgi:AmiR/NasT family two-component response regulator
VEQAKGMIAAQQAIGVDAAFAVLHRYANDHNATLAEVADAVINLGLQL